MASFTLTWAQLATAIGALQGLLLTAVLVAQRKNRTANRLLAALMATFTIFLASGLYHETGVIRTYPHFFGFGYQTPWVFGPLIYLYARAASDRSWEFRRRELIHFLPVAISISLALPYYFASGPEKVALFDRWLVQGTPSRLAWFDPFKYLSGLGYSIATVLYLRRHRHRVEISYSNTARRNLSWLLWLTASAFGIWILATVLRITDFAPMLRDAPISLAMAVLIYAIGYRGLNQPEVWRYETAEYAVPVRSVTSVPAPDAAPETPAIRYERSGLDAGEIDEIKRALLDTMDREQPWKDSDLTLADLATRLGTTPHKLSEVLNAGVGQTFYDFVNGYRVRDVQRRIEAGESERRKMLALALDAGFASKSTFNQAFKKHAGVTPSEFRERAAGRGQTPDRAA